MELIINEIEKGHKRYDPSDIRYFDLINKDTFLSALFRKIFLGLCEVFPIVIRKLLNVKKKIYPTGYTHFIESMLVLELN